MYPRIRNSPVGTIKSTKLEIALHFVLNLQMKLLISVLDIISRACQVARFIFIYFHRKPVQLMRVISQQHVD